MEAVNLLSSNKYTEKQIVRAALVASFARTSISRLGLLIHFGDHEFQLGDEAINHPEHSQRYHQSKSDLH